MPTATNTAKNTAISPNFLVWKFCEKVQFPKSFEQFAQNFCTRKLSKITVFYKVKLAKLITYLDEFLPTKSHPFFITWS